MTKKAYWHWLTIIALFIHPVCAFAVSIPDPSSIDPRPKVITYVPDNVVKVFGHEGYQTLIQFSRREIVNTILLGDHESWKFKKLGHDLFIRPVAASKTNMVVQTNTHIYHFELDSTNKEVSPTHILRFIYPSDGFDVNGK